jgi:inorganic pyrophosphatase
VSTSEPGNPIKQDERKGKPRSYNWGDMMFNYGMFPQTWEDPCIVSEETGCKGDGDPLDAVEVGTRQMQTGEVAEVKVLGVLAMIDDGETDWKVLTIRTADPMASKLNDVDDLEREMPGAISSLREWLRVYKVVDGKPENSFALDERCMPRDYAVKVLQETHELWAGKYGHSSATAAP